MAQPTLFDYDDAAFAEPTPAPLACPFPWWEAGPDEVWAMRRDVLVSLLADLSDADDNDGAQTAADCLAADEAGARPAMLEGLRDLADRLANRQTFEPDERAAWQVRLLGLAAAGGDRVAAQAVNAAVTFGQMRRADWRASRVAWLRATHPARAAAPGPVGDAVRAWLATSTQDEIGEPRGAARRAAAAPREPERLVVASSLALRVGEEDLAWPQAKALARPLPLGGDFRCDAAGRFILIETLRREFPWMAGVIDAVEAQMRLAAAMDRWRLHVRPMLLVGPPGGGKTRFALRLAELSGCGHGLLNAGGSTDNRLLAGTARGWSTTYPSLPAQVIARTGCANPVIVIDEIEKSGASDRNGRITETLLTMIEPVSARQWPDECLVAPLDLSRVNWILTANSLTGLGAPLLSRLEIIETGMPAPEHFDDLLAGVLADIADSFGRKPWRLPRLLPADIAALRAGFAADPSPRRLHAAALGALSRALARPEGPVN